MVRTRVDEVSVQGRNTQGVRLIRLKEGEKMVGLERVDEPEEVEEDLTADAATADQTAADTAESPDNAADATPDTDSDDE